MKKQLLISLLIVTLIGIGRTFGQDEPLSPSIIGTGVYYGLTAPLKDLPTISKEEWHEMVLKAEQKALNKKLKDRSYPYESIALPKGTGPSLAKANGYNRNF
jgi:hypothetical protein